MSILKDGIIDVWYTNGNGEELTTEVEIPESTLEEGEAAICNYMDQWCKDKESDKYSNVGYTNPF